MRRTFGLLVLMCPRCADLMRPVAVISQKVVIERILGHLQLPTCPVAVSAPHSFGLDVMGYELRDAPMADEWVQETDSEAWGEPTQRGPPDEFDGVDPPAAED